MTNKKGYDIIKKALKKIVSMIIIATMVLGLGTSVYAADTTGSTTEESTMAASNSNFHKVNGIATESGGSYWYTSTTTKVCHTLKAEGSTIGSTTGAKTLVIHVYYNNSNTPIAGGKITLDGKFHTIPTLSGLGYFPAGTYRIYVQPSFVGGYDVSTYFYE